MPVTEFDNLLREQFEQGSFEYKPANWERVSKMLPEPKKKKPLIKRLFWIPLAAAAATAGFIVLPLLKDEQVQPTVAQHHVANKHVPSVATPASSAPAAPASRQQMPAVVPAAAPGLRFSVSRNAGVASTSPNYTQSPIASTVLPSSGNAATTPGNDMIPPPVQPEQVAINTPQALPEVADAPLTPGFREPVQFISNSRNASMSYIIDGIQYEEPRQKIINSSLSIAGGYKYGTANTGYMIGLNGRRKLGDRLYVEGDLAFANNRNAQITNETSNETFDQVKAVSGTNAVAARALSRGEVVANTYYLQLTPVVGYQLLKNISVGAGADVQRMIGSAESTTYIMEGNEVKAMPQMDYGVVGKAEYTISKMFKAGVQYRQGMNNVVSPDKDFLNRSYFQVQLKLGILGK